MNSTSSRNAIVYVVRHAQTEWNVQGIIQGQQDSPLTADGERQASALSSELQNVKIDAVFSSDLPRAVRTAEILAGGKNLPVNALPTLRERKWGRYEGRPSFVYHDENFEQLRRAQHLPEAERWKFKVKDDIESDAEVLSRILAALDEIVAAYGGKTSLVVTHGGPMRLLLRHFGSRSAARTGSFGNVGVIELVWDGAGFSVQKINGVE